MKAPEMLNMIAAGPFDIELTTEIIPDCDGYGEKGMRATITKVKKEDDLILVTFDYNKYRSFSIPLESATYNGNETATEYGTTARLGEEYYFNLDDDGFGVNDPTYFTSLVE